MSSNSNLGAAKPPAKHFRLLRKVAGWIITCVVLPAALLAAFEIFLRMAGYGQCMDPFLRQTMNGETVYVRNKAFLDQFFVEPMAGNYWYREMYSFAVPQKKADKAYRLFVFGSSAAVGWPDAQYSFSNMLDLMLEESYPGVRFEVYNCAVSASNSHVMRKMAEACAKLSPDAFLVYMGNNEYHGLCAKASQSNVAPQVLPSKVRHLLIELQQFRLFQLVQNIHSWWTGAGPASSQPGNQETVRPDSPLVDRASENYRENLAALCDTAKRAGVPVFLSTLGANLRHWTPTDPTNLGILSEADKGQWDQWYAKGEMMQRQGDYTGALSAYLQAAAIDDAHAGLQFYLGECYWQTEEYDAARFHFTRAMDLDTFLWVRCKTRINDIIRATACQDNENVYLVDSAQSLRQASPHGITGSEFFFDGCHLKFEGKHVVAQAFFSQLVPRLPEWIRGLGAQMSVPLSAEDCARFLGHSPSVQLKSLKIMVDSMRKIGKEPNEILLNEIAAIEHQTIPQDKEEALQVCREAVARFDGCPEMRVRLINQLIAASLLDEALEQAKSLATEYPCHKHSHALLAHILFKLGQYDAASNEFDRALELYPDDVDTILEYIKLRIEQGGADQAMLLIEEANRRAKSALWWYTVRAQIISAKGDTLASLGDLPAAVRTYSQAIELDPAGADPYRALDRIYKANNDMGDRETFWLKMTSEHEDRSWPWYFLGIAREASKDLDGAIDAFEHALKAASDNLEVRSAMGNALSAKGAELLEAGENTKALELFQRAQSFTANQAATELGIGRALEIKGELEAAVQAYLRAIEQAPAMLDPYEALAQTYAAHAHLGDIGALWQEMTEKHPDRMWPWHFLGLALERKNDWDGAIAAYEQSLKTSSENQGTVQALSRVLSAKAMKLLEAREYAQALELFRRAQSISASQPAAAFGIGRVLESTGKIEEAVQAYLQAVEFAPAWYDPYEALDRIYAANKNLGDIEGLWRTRTDQHLDHHLAWFCLGLARERKDDLEGAIAAYEQSLKASSENQGTAQALSRVLSAKAMKLLEAREYDQALELFRRAQSISAAQPEAAFGIGCVLEATGKIEEAVQAYLQAVEFAPAWYDPYEALDRIYAANNNLGDIEGLWRTRTDQHPDHHLAWFCLGLARERKDDLDGAIAAYEQSLKVSSENQGTAQALSRALSAKAMKLLEAREYAQALALFRRAQSISAAQPEAAFGIGRVLEATGKIEEAAQAYLQAVEFGPAWYDPYEALDRIYAANNNLGDIEGLWRTRTDQHPDHHLAWFCLGLARERKDDLDGAIAAYEQSLKIVPSASGTQQALDRAKQAKANTSNNQ